MEASKVVSYQEFIRSKGEQACTSGFKPLWTPDFLFDFQKHLVEWSLLKGKAAIFADCGLGKTPMQLVWAENIVRKTNGNVLVLTPLAVSAQTVREGAKFGIECRQSRDGKVTKGITVTNYEQLVKFLSSDFAGVVCDESGILKSFDGATKKAVIEFMRLVPYRLLCTATAAPNDYDELGNSSEALGEMGHRDMLTRFFTEKDSSYYVKAWGQKSTKFRLRGYAEKDFWRWVCSWARAVRKPSDLGYDDGPFLLPRLNVRTHQVKVPTPLGYLRPPPAKTLDEQRREQRQTIRQRCEKAAGIVSDTRKAAVCWCHLNPEGDLLKSLIKGSEQVSGKDSDDRKEEMFEAFSSGQLRVLVTKPKLGGWGLNWQHCAHQTFFPSHSFEAWYQCVRRSLRFGQKNTVRIDVITTEGGVKVLANLRRKQEQAEQMFSQLVAAINDSLRIEADNYDNGKVPVPCWLS